jgi:hypothetical protein
VVAASEAVLDSSLIVGALVAGPLAHLLGVRGAMAVSGLGFVLAALLARRLLGLGTVPEGLISPDTALPGDQAMSAPGVRRVPSGAT